MKKLITLALLFSIYMPSATTITASQPLTDIVAVQGMSKLVTTLILWNILYPANPHALTKDEEITFENFIKNPKKLFEARIFGHKDCIVKPIIPGRGLGYIIEFLEKLGKVAAVSTCMCVGLKVIDQIIAANFNNPLQLVPNFKTYCALYLVIDIK